MEESRRIHHLTHREVLPSDAVFVTLALLFIKEAMSVLFNAIPYNSIEIAFFPLSEVKITSRMYLYFLMEDFRGIIDVFIIYYLTGWKFVLRLLFYYVAIAAEYLLRYNEPTLILGYYLGVKHIGLTLLGIMTTLALWRNVRRFTSH